MFVITSKGYLVPQWGYFQSHYAAWNWLLDEGFEDMDSIDVVEVNKNNG